MYERKIRNEKDRGRDKNKVSLCECLCSMSGCALCIQIEQNCPSVKTKWNKTKQNKAYYGKTK